MGRRSRYCGIKRDNAQDNSDAIRGVNCDSLEFDYITLPMGGHDKLITWRHIL